MTAGLSITMLAAAGPGIGLGHVRRCQALAAALRAVAIDADVVTGDHESGWTRDVDDACREIARRKSEVVVVDSYAVTPDVLRGLRAVGLSVVVIDDVADRMLPVPLVVNGGYRASRWPYRGDPDTVFLLGSAYALLHPAFAMTPIRSPAREVRRVLVTLGGDPPADSLEAAVAAVLRGAPAAFVDVAVGPFFGGAVIAHERVRAHQGLESLRELMLASDLAVTGGGMTLYECLATGTPAVGICLAENQRPNLESMGRDGLIASAVPSLVDALGALLDDADRREAMSRRGREVVDGRGASRVADAIVRLATSVGTPRFVR